MHLARHGLVPMASQQARITLMCLIATAKTNKMDKAAAFLGDLKRLSAVSSYLSSFVDGIDVYTKPNDVLHVSLTQHITSTGRFSGRKP
jgi:hypothetical protein